MSNSSSNLPTASTMVLHSPRSLASTSTTPLATSLPSSTTSSSSSSPIPTIAIATGSLALASPLARQALPLSDSNHSATVSSPSAVPLSRSYVDATNSIVTSPVMASIRSMTSLASTPNGHLNIDPSWFADATHITRSGRQSRHPVPYVAQAVVPSKNPKDMVVEQGRGEFLENIPNVWHRIKSHASLSTELKKFVSLCFPLYKGSLKQKTKEKLKRFSGLISDAEKKSAKNKIIRLFKEEPIIIPVLAQIMDIMYEGTQNDITEKMMEFLEAPKANNRELSGKKLTVESLKKDKRKKSSSDKKKSSVKKKKQEKSDKTDRRESDEDSKSTSKKRKRESDSDDEDDESLKRKQEKKDKRKSSEKTEQSEKKKDKDIEKNKENEQEDDKSKKRGRPKGKKPKRNTEKVMFASANSFFVYSSANRDVIREEFPKMSLVESTAELAKRWKLLSPEEKEPYILASKKLRADARLEVMELERAKKAAKQDTEDKQEDASHKKHKQKKEIINNKAKPLTKRKRNDEDNSSDASQNSGSRSSGASDSGSDFPKLSHKRNKFEPRSSDDVFMDPPSDEEEIRAVPATVLSSRPNTHHYGNDSETSESDSGKKRNNFTNGFH